MEQGKIVFELDELFGKLAQKVVKDLEDGSLDVKERAKLFVAMLPYKFPKLQQIESKNQNTTQITIFGDVGD